MVPNTHYLILSAALFCIGAGGMILRRNVITMFMCIELMLNAVNLAFVTFSTHLNQGEGQVFVLFVMTVAAAEAAVGLALIVGLSRRAKSLDIDEASTLKW